MTTLTTITAPATDALPVPACPTWCPLPVSHVNRTTPLGEWSRFHPAWSGAMTFRDGPERTAEITVDVEQYEASECGEDYVLEPVRLWVRGVDGDSSMTADEVAVFADLIAMAASVVARISGGRA